MPLRDSVTCIFTKGAALPKCFYFISGDGECLLFCIFVACVTTFACFRLRHLSMSTWFGTSRAGRSQQLRTGNPRSTLRSFILAHQGVREMTRSNRTAILCLERFGKSTNFGISPRVKVRTFVCFIGCRQNRGELDPHDW